MIKKKSGSEEIEDLEQLLGTLFIHGLHSQMVIGPFAEEELRCRIMMVNWIKFWGSLYIMMDFREI